MNVKATYDLEERTAKFGKAVIKFVRIMPENAVTRPLISQVVRSATSIGANYCEADNAESRNDFKHKISICKKEAKETKHWLSMIEEFCRDRKNELDELYREAKELTLIFNAIVNSTKKNSSIEH